MATADLQSNISSTFGVSSESDYHVTVVSVHNDIPTKENSYVVEDNSIATENTVMSSNTPPQPAPRHFVTVVSVESESLVKVDGNVALDAHTRVRLDVPAGGHEKVDVPMKEKVTPMETIVYRLPGERLGFGLKFDGGMGSTETVRRLYIQSVSPDSPASRASVPWGHFDAGDEIVNIEDTAVSTLTRVECVNRLKEASVKLTLRVLQGNGEVPSVQECCPTDGKIRKAPAPPPLPLRLRNRKIPARPPKEAMNLPPPEGFGDIDYASDDSNVSNDKIESDKSILSRQNTDILPPAAAVYLDLLSEEEKNLRLRYESGSDETNSSASTVVDKLSLSSSSRTVSRNSSFNTSVEVGQFDLARAVSPFEHLEEEIRTEGRKGAITVGGDGGHHLHNFNINNSDTFQASSVDSALEAIEENHVSISSVSAENPITDSKKGNASPKPLEPQNNPVYEGFKVPLSNSFLPNFPKKVPKRPAPMPPSNPYPLSSYNKSLNTIDSDHSFVNIAGEQDMVNSDVIAKRFKIGEDAGDNIPSCEILTSTPIKSFPQTVINKLYGKTDAHAIFITPVTEAEEPESLESGGSYLSDENDFPYYEKPLDVDILGALPTELGESFEPIDVLPYGEDSSFFVDRVSNPSYELTQFEKEQVDHDDQGKQEGIYEEIHSSSDSNSWLRNSDMDLSDHSGEEPPNEPVNEIDESEKEDSVTHQAFSRISRNSRRRDDISEAIREELSLPKDAEIDVEEIEEVETSIQCETEDEVLLVLRALRRDNSLYLEDSSRTSSKDCGNTTAPPSKDTKRHSNLEKILEKRDEYLETKINTPSYLKDAKSPQFKLQQSGKYLDGLKRYLQELDNGSSHHSFRDLESLSSPDSGQQSLGSEPLSSIPEDQVFPLPPITGTRPSISVEPPPNENISEEVLAYSSLSDSRLNTDSPLVSSGSDSSVGSDNPRTSRKSSNLNYDDSYSGENSPDFRYNRTDLNTDSHLCDSDSDVCSQFSIDVPSVDTDAPSDALESEGAMPSVIDSQRNKNYSREGATEDVGLSLYDPRYTVLSAQDVPPTRLPPDGHEFPPHYTEGLQDKINRFGRYSYLQESELDHALYSTSNSSTLPRGATKMVSPGETRSLSRWRRQDERSERSVKDKIAMFSTEKDQPEQKTRKLNRSESISSVSSDKLPGKSSTNTEDLLNGYSKREKSASLTKPSFSSMQNVHSSDYESKENLKPTLETRKQKKQSFSSRPRESSDVPPGLNNRSQSLLDIGKNSGGRMKRHSVGAYDRPFVYKYGVEKPEERERRTSLNNLIEQRRKSMSKLRGLIIPETRTGDDAENRFSLDLPKISSHNASQAIKSLSLQEESVGKLNNERISSPESFSKYNSGSNTSLRSRYKSASSENRKVSGSPNLPPSRPRSTPSTSGEVSRRKSPQRNMDSYSEKRSESFDSEDSTLISNTSTSPKSLIRKLSFNGRLNRGAEESDNDSSVSTQSSSFSQGLSPRDSPMPDTSDQEDSSYSYMPSTHRHSSQSSFDELDGKRVLKTGSVEAKNRRNVIKSAKCSSGKSSDEQTTPEVSRKHSSSSLEAGAKITSSESKVLTRRRNLQRQPSSDSTSSTSSKYSPKGSLSRRNSRDSTIPVRGDGDIPSAQPVYFDKKGDMFKESQIKVAYLNEIADDFEEVNDHQEIFAEVRLHCKQSSPKASHNDSTVNLKDEKWSSLEQKYSDKLKLGESYSDKTRSGVTTKKTNFEALASKWKQRAEEDPIPRHPHNRHLNRRDSSSKNDKTKEGVKCQKSESKTNRNLERADSDLKSDSSNYGSRPTSLQVPRADIHDRKYSVPEYGVKYREKKEGSNGEVSSRPSSLIEGSHGMNPLQQDGQYIVSLSSSLSTDSHDDLLDSSESSLSRAGSKEVLDAFMKPQMSSVIPKMSEIMKALERHDLGRKGVPNFSTSHPRMSSLDSTASDDGSQGALYGSVSSLASGQRDQYGSITSLSSSTSIISPQELAQLIEEANHSLEESGTPSHEILVVVLHREVVGYGSIGITLAGGADYDTKEVTVHKVIPGSLADRDGRIQKGDRVISINGKTLRGVTHREALSILKSPRPEVVLVLSRSRSVTPQENTLTHSNSGDGDGVFCHRPVFINHVPPPRPPKILESPLDSKSLVSDLPCETVPRGPPLTINLIKEGAGLGFSLEGGKDSPLGDRPLTIKKIFSGGAADKGGILLVGDELLSVNSVDLTNMARIEAWNFLKKLPDGTVSLVIRQKLKECDTQE